MEMVGQVKPWKTEIFWWSCCWWLRSLDSATLLSREERKDINLGITEGLSSSAMESIVGSSKVLGIDVREREGIYSRRCMINQ